MTKIETKRNDRCFCNSGAKYKKCCEPTVIQLCKGLPPNLFTSDNIKRAAKTLKAQEELRVKQQGHGIPIISYQEHGIRFVKVREKLYHSKTWQTFHDFLFDYIKITLGEDWGNAELKKHKQEQNPILIWYQYVCELQQKHSQIPGEIYTGTMNGAAIAYLTLAYNLYLIAHNNKDIQTDLIRRLKNTESFHGAYYETHVAASFIKAGFDLDFENEQDGSTTHCEFTAISRKTGGKYSVEAKARAIEGILGKKDGAKNKTPLVKRQLIKALKKKALHPRIVFIDINIPNNECENKHFLEALKDIHDAENNLKIGGKLAPKAYIALTNFPYDHHKESFQLRCSTLLDSFKIPNFRHNFESTLKEVITAREEHSDLHHLAKSIQEHYDIPATFDGEFPQFAFHQKGQPRILIGKRYLIPDGTGPEIEAELIDASVLEEQQEIWGVYRTIDGRQIICKNKMTEEELSAYKTAPDVFFGIKRNTPKQIEKNDTLGMYEFLHSTYKNSTKDQLLEFMKHHPDIEALKKLNQKELASIYCERMSLQTSLH